MEIFATGIYTGNSGKIKRFILMTCSGNDA